MSAKAPLTLDERATKALTKEGGWEKVCDSRGEPFFIHRATGETTVDLKLYLEVADAVAGGPMRPWRDAAGAIEGAPVPVSSMDRASVNGHDIDARSGGASPSTSWISLLLKSKEGTSERALSEAEEREKRLHAKLAWTEEQLRMERQRSQASENDGVKLRAALSDHQRELHQLQSVVFYGLGDARTRGYAPAVLDTVESRRDHDPNDLMQRIHCLEGALEAVQHQNRQLQQQLQSALVAPSCAKCCGGCNDRDPWRRLLDGAMGLRRPAGDTTGRGDGSDGTGMKPRHGSTEGGVPLFPPRDNFDSQLVPVQSLGSSFVTDFSYPPLGHSTHTQEVRTDYRMSSRGSASYPSMSPLTPPPNSSAPPRTPTALVSTPRQQRW